MIIPKWDHHALRDDARLFLSDTSIGYRFRQMACQKLLPGLLHAPGSKASSPNAC